MQLSQRRGALVRCLHPGHHRGFSPMAYVGRAHTPIRLSVTSCRWWEWGERESDGTWAEHYEDGCDRGRYLLMTCHACPVVTQRDRLESAWLVPQPAPLRRTLLLQLEARDASRRHAY